MNSDTWELFLREENIDNKLLYDKIKEEKFMSLSKIVGSKRFERIDRLFSIEVEEPIDKVFHSQSAGLTHRQHL